MVDERLSDTIRTWDDLKSALGLRPATLRKLQASDPHQTTDKGEPLHLVWNEAGITTTDARALWGVLSQDATDASDATPDGDASPAVVDEPTAKR